MKNKLKWKYKHFKFWLVFTGIPPREIHQPKEMKVYEIYELQSFVAIEQRSEKKTNSNEMEIIAR